MRNKVIAAFVIVLLIAGGGWWYRTRSSRAAAQDGVQYRQEPVRRGEIRATISGTGPIASVNGVMVKANQSGTVAEIKAQDGDRVKAGQVIMVLHNDTVEASLRQAQIDLQSTQTSLDNLLNPQPTSVQAQELKVENARLTIKQRQTDVANLTVTAPHDGVVSSVKLATGSAVTANALLFTIFDDSAPTFTAMMMQQVAADVTPGQKATVEITGFGRVEGVVRQSGAGATPMSGNKDASVPIDIALPSMPGLRAGMVGVATIQSANQTYLLQGNGAVKNDAVEVRAQVAGTVGALSVKEGDRVKVGDTMLQIENESLRVSLRQAENDLATQEYNLKVLRNPALDTGSQVYSLRNKLEQAQITLNSRQNDYQDLFVKAPVDGQISSLTIRVGDKITNNQSLFRVADYGIMQVTIMVDELDVAKAAVGKSAGMTLDALPGKSYTGKVTKINPEGVFKNDIATFEVTVTIENPVGLMAGMNATVNVVTDERNGLYLPASAVQVRQGRATVQVLENGQPAFKEIEVGLRTSQRIEVKSGLKEGDMVITTIIRPTTTGGQGFGLFGGQRVQGGPGGNQTTFPNQGGGGGFGGGGNGNRNQGQGQAPSGGR